MGSTATQRGSIEQAVHDFCLQLIHLFFLREILWLFSISSLAESPFAKSENKTAVMLIRQLFLTELFLPIPPKVSLITRPRRFGKTLMISMLQEFLDIQKSSQAIFSGLAVSQNAALCQSWMNQYPTVFITFKDLRGENYSSTEGQVINLLRSLCIEHTYLLESEKVDPVDQERLLALKKGLANHNDVVDSLNILCRALKYHWGNQLYYLLMNMIHRLPQLNKMVITKK